MRRTVGLAILAAIAASLALATAVEAALPDPGRPLAVRKLKIKTTDRRPGGLLDADLTWTGRGPYRATVVGTVQDVEADGYCVVAYAYGDGVRELVSERACPNGVVKTFRYSWHKRRVWRALIRVCLVGRNGGERYCSAWS